MKNYNLIFEDNFIRIKEFLGTGVDVNNIDGFEVMHVWEHPLMKKHADIVCQFGGDILEIGFGMGISANYIQSNNIKSHTIVEFHPQVIEKLIQWSKDKPNVRIIEGDWFEKLEEICSMKYDGIFFDTHLDPNVYFLVESVVNRCLKEGGVFSWFSPYGYPVYGVLNFITDSVDVDPNLDKAPEFENITRALAPYYIKNT
jgi:spermidine synthase